MDDENSLLGSELGENSINSKAVIFGCEGIALTDWERSFFREQDPLGFILFKRNCDTPDQVKSLVEDLRASVNRPSAPVLIDQEGGRVQRLGPPYWRQAPSGAVFADLYEKDPEKARRALWINTRLIADELRILGIDVDCLPVLDVPQQGAHDVIGDRAYGRNPQVIAELGQAAAEGLMAGAVLPVIKHIPGHGRAVVDSHFELPRVTASHECLSETDFVPFKVLGGLPWGMTAHVIFEALDQEEPATTSKHIVSHMIRDELGFDGLLLSDDLSMQALSGTLGTRAKAAIAAGCDVALHCNGKRDEMIAVAEVTPNMTADAKRRFAVGRQLIAKGPGPCDAKALLVELEGLLGLVTSND